MALRLLNTEKNGCEKYFTSIFTNLSYFENSQIISQQVCKAKTTKRSKADIPDPKN